MAEDPRITPLELRKRLLVARSEAQRQTLATEVSRIRQATAWVPQVGRSLRHAGPWLVVAAAIAGFLLVRNRQGAWRLVTVAVAGWRSVAWLWRLVAR